MNALGLAGVVVVEQEFRLLDEDRPLRAILITDGAGAADHLLGRNAVDALRIDADEILAAAGDDAGAVADAAEIFEELDLRRVGEFGVRPLPARIARLRDPLCDLVAERVDVHASQGRGGDLEQRLKAELRDRLGIAGQHGAERLDIGKFGLGLHQIPARDQSNRRAGYRSGAPPTACRPGRRLQSAPRAARSRGLRRRSSHGRI